MPKKGYRPQRSCLGCGKPDDQGKLIRLIVGDENRLKIARLGGGRGGYLHHAQECWQAFLRRKTLRRAFHAEVSRIAKEKLVQELKGPERE